MDYKYNSADNHLDPNWLPKDLWQSRVASRFKARAPKVVETDEGSFWEWEGKRQLESADGKSNYAHHERFRGMGVETPAGSLPPSDPKLRYVYSECNIGWAPYFIEWMDRQEKVRGPLRELDDAASKLSMPPSEYFKRQIRVTFEDDPVGGRMIREGVGQPARDCDVGGGLSAQLPVLAEPGPDHRPNLRRR